jgi:hypothetical protein
MASLILARVYGFSAKKRSTEVWRLRCLGLGFGDDGCLAGERIFRHGEKYYIHVRLVLIASKGVNKDIVSWKQED